MSGASFDPGKLNPKDFLHGAVSYQDLVNPEKFGRKAPEPVTRERLIDVLADQEYKFSIDDDGDPVGVWDQNLVWFMFLGAQKSFLQVRARWHRKVADNSRLALLQAMNDWNRDKLWPKVFTRQEPDSPGFLHVYTEVSTDFTAGATDDQLRQAVLVALEASSRFFTSLSATVTPLSEE